MEKRSDFVKSLSVLVFFMIGIMAFIKGNIGQILQVLAFSLWAIYLMFTYGSTYLKRLYNFLKSKEIDEPTYSIISTDTSEDETLKDLNELKQNYISPINQEDNIDIYSWFKNIGKEKFEEIITELKSKDCSEFKITEDGSVFITENNEEVKITVINSVPPKNQWNDIIPLIQDIGCLGYLKNDEIIVNL